MDILPTPTDSTSTPKDIRAFLQSLQQHAGGPHVCSSPVSFVDKSQKRSWTEHFPDASFGGNLTYSQLFEKAKDGTENRIVLFQRPVGKWVAVPKGETTRTHADWHAFAVAWIKRPNVSFGKDLVVFDVECLTPAEVGKWAIVSMPLIRGFVQYCRSQKPKRLINNVWYWQNTEHRGMDEGLGRSLEWLKELTLMGDQELSEMDWESQGFQKIGLRSHLSQ